MKKKILLPGFLIGVMISCFFIASDWQVFGVVSLAAFIVLTVYATNKKTVLKYTRWAKYNPRTAQVWITFLMILLMITGLLSGKNLEVLGYEISDFTGYVFFSLMIIGFMSVPFLPKRNAISVPQEVKTNRLGYLTIVLSSVMLMAFLGNRLNDIQPDAQFTQTLNAVDAWIYSDQDIQNELPPAIGELNGEKYYFGSNKSNVPLPLLTVHTIPKKSKKELRKERRKLKKIAKKFRKAAGGGKCALGVLLIILLLVPTCAGICLIIGGAGSGGGIGYVLGGAALLGASVWGMIKAGQLCTK